MTFVLNIPVNSLYYSPLFTTKKGSQHHLCRSLHFLWPWSDAASGTMAIFPPLLRALQKENNPSAEALGRTRILRHLNPRANWKRCWKSCPTRQRQRQLKKLSSIQRTAIEFLRRIPIRTASTGCSRVAFPPFSNQKKSPISTVSFWVSVTSKLFFWRSCSKKCWTRTGSSPSPSSRLGFRWTILNPECVSSLSSRFVLLPAMTFSGLVATSLCFIRTCNSFLLEGILWEHCEYRVDCLRLGFRRVDRMYCPCCHQLFVFMLLPPEW